MGREVYVKTNAILTEFSLRMSLEINQHRSHPTQLVFTWQPMSDESISAIIIDNGSHTIKGGHGGDKNPCTVFPTVVGRPKSHVSKETIGGGKDEFIGDEAVNKREYLELKSPVDKGTIVNWEDMERIWQHTFYNEMCVAPENRPVLLTEIPDDFKESREKTAQIMFETFNVPVIFLRLKG
jgi:actin